MLQEWSLLQGKKHTTHTLIRYVSCIIQNHSFLLATSHGTLTQPDKITAGDISGGPKEVVVPAAGVSLLAWIYHVLPTELRNLLYHTCRAKH